MSNRAYLGVWCHDFPEALILERFGKMLGTVPFSISRTGFTHLTIRAVDLAEQPILEQDLRGFPLDARGIVEIAQSHLNSDCSYEVAAEWDLWTFESQTAKSQLEPQALGIICQGTDFNDGAWRESGHFEVDFGFEHFFTGHAGLLGFRGAKKIPPESAEEERFLTAMAWPENLHAYQDKTRENIRKAFGWVRAIEQAIPAAQIKLWSEGEDNFEARLEEILASR
ncbi:MAG: hypothetical protein ACRD52_15680 [Candidatus Acidiferrales bacterium]